ncbi:MAG: TatD family hydrolase [Vibrionaceae bacterium]
MFVDSHCHLDKLDYNSLHADVKSVVANAKARGVAHILCVGVSLESFLPMQRLIAPFDNVFAACGVHPLDLSGPIDIALLEQYASMPNVVALGETGLDYYYDHKSKLEQQQAFAQHIFVAKKLDKPLIVHTRMAKNDTLSQLKAEGAQQVGGVLHCFTEDLPMAKAAIDLGFYISISGIVTFNKAAELKEVVKALPLDRLLIETDSPYLAPVPFRGKENQPAYVKEVADYIGVLKGMSGEQIGQITTDNFFRLFRFAKRASS